MIGAVILALRDKALRDKRIPADPRSPELRAS
jgi:hypothetical protein